MTEKTIRRITGVLLILGAVLINVPYTLLIMHFDYPDILRSPAHTVLERFHSGGPGLVWVWFAFAWTGLPLLFGAVLLGRAVQKDSPLTHAATTIGVIGFVVQFVGLLRWTFVVPVLARMYVDPAATPAARDAVVVVFTAVHQFGGVLLGEHIGQAFSVIWTAMVSAIMFKDHDFPAWLSWLGWTASSVYVLAQAELLATAIPGFPELGWAGLVGSLLWLLWILLTGTFLLRARRAAGS